MDNIINYWDNIAKDQPFWGVLTDDKFKLSNIDKTKDEFYTSGIDHKKYMFNYLNEINYNFLLCSENNALEIGSGTGRISIHMFPEFKKLYCVDVSETYMEICKNILEISGANNFEMVHYSNFYTPDRFENISLIYTFITLQHNPPDEILKIVKRVCELLMKGGIAFLHIPYFIPNYTYVDKLIMQMNMVAIENVVNIIENNSCQILKVDDTIDMCGGGIKNCIYIFTRI